jgi:ubiquinone/menaquinone biosynthesis C-methylase UbiE
VEFSNSLQDLHNRYLLQAKWTAENRHRLYQSAKLHQASRVLEVGSGTSAIIHEIARYGLGTAYGIDIDSKAVLYAHAVDPRTRYTVGDGLHLPYRTGTFDVTICHFLLMWVRDPIAILKEMVRVTKVDGTVLALAEPDYGGRIDFPEPLEPLGRHQADSLEAQGADPQIGRKLRMLFSQVGLENIHIGILGGEWYGMPDEMSLDSEWRILAADLEGRLSIEQLGEFQELDRSAWTQGFRVLFVPTFYAIGWKKDS